MVTTPQSIAEALDGLAATDDDIARTLAAAGYPEPRVREPGSATLLNIIVARKGLGRWSAEIYMLFAPGRADIWPADDLALRVAVHRLKGLNERPDRATMDRLAEPWRPYRGAVALLMWHVYRKAAL